MFWNIFQFIMTQCVAQRPLLTFSDIFDLSWPYLGWVNLRSKVNALFLSTRGLQGTQNWSKGLEMKEETLGNPSVFQTSKVKVIVKVTSSIAFIMYQICLRNSRMFGNMYLLIMILRVAQRLCLTLSDFFLYLAWHYPGRVNSRSKLVAFFCWPDLAPGKESITELIQWPRPRSRGDLWP